MTRSSSFRQDIVCRIQGSGDTNLVIYVIDRVRRMLDTYQTDPSARLIVCTPMRNEAHDVNDLLSCPKYYSDCGDAREKRQAIEQWRTGVSKVMVATSAFGVGIDFPSVHQVIHVGAPTDMIGFAQEIGRLSRNGQGGIGRIILPRGWRSLGLPNLVDQCRSAVSELAMLVYLDDNRCLSAVISRFLDGAEQMQYCQADDLELRCSKCEQFGLFDSTQETDHTRWWDPDSGSGRIASSEEDERTDAPSKVRIDEEREAPGGGGGIGDFETICVPPPSSRNDTVSGYRCSKDAARSV